MASRNVHTNAKALAKIAAYMANKGTFREKKLISEKTWEDFHSEPTEGSLPSNLNTSRFTKGGFNMFTSKFDIGPFDEAINYGRDGFYGWVGTGGSTMQWHPELKIGFAYVPGDIIKMDFASYRSCLL